MKRRPRFNKSRILSIMFIPMFAHMYAYAGQTGSLRVNTKRLAQRIEKLAEFGKTPEGGVNRVAFKLTYYSGLDGYLTPAAQDSSLLPRLKKSAS